MNNNHLQQYKWIIITAGILLVIISLSLFLISKAKPASKPAITVPTALPNNSKPPPRGPFAGGGYSTSEGSLKK